VLLQKLAEARNKHAIFFFSQTVSTVESTKKFLESFIEADNHKRMYFLLNFIQGTENYLGHIGYEVREGEYIEILSVLKFGEFHPYKFMKASLKSLILCLESEFGMLPIKLQVLKSNERAIAFYRSVGFEELGTKDEKLGNLEMWHKPF
jgi:RimJ/RimL family protein N-acetyltransferase